MHLSIASSSACQLSSRLNWASVQQRSASPLLRPCSLAALQRASSRCSFVTVSCPGLGSMPWLAAAWPSTCCASSSGKGFGKTAPTQRSVDSDDSTKSSTGSPNDKQRQRARKLRPVPSVPNQAERDQQAGKTFSVASLQEAIAPPSEEDNAFAERLAAMKVASEERARAAAASKSAAEMVPFRLGGPSISVSNSSGIKPAAFDVPIANSSSDGRSSKDIYKDPPSLAKTFGFGSAKDSSIADPKLRDAAIGPNQIGLAVIAIALVGVFLLVSSGDYQPSRRQPVRPANMPPDALEAKLIQSRITDYERRLTAQPGDPDALEALAVSYAQLFEFDKAGNLLDRLLATNPKDADAWRLLGETRLLADQPSKAVAAYERGLALRPKSAQMLTGIAEAYLANGQPAKAADLLLSRRASIVAAAKTATAAAAVAAGPPAAPAATETGAGSAEASGAAIAVLPEALDAGVGSSGEAGGSSVEGVKVKEQKVAAAAVDITGISKPLDPVTLELLLGKVYNSWRGHEADALAVYDGITRTYPEDFRGYLAKGVYLKEKGRGSDAERMFLQARFYAPEGKQGIVRQISEYSPPINLPS